MTLASMMNLSEDALICDLAETYHIYDYRSLPLQLVATLSAGLRENSRIKLLATDMPVSMDTLILAAIADNISLFRAGFAKEKPKQPFLFTDAILDNNKKNKRVGFRSGSEVEAALAKLRGE